MLKIYEPEKKNETLKQRPQSSPESKAESEAEASRLFKYNLFTSLIWFGAALVLLLIISLPLDLCTDIPSVGCWLLGLFIGVSIATVIFFSIRRSFESRRAEELSSGILIETLEKSFSASVEYSPKYRISDERRKELEDLKVFPIKSLEASEHLVVKGSSSNFETFDLIASGKIKEDSEVSFRNFSGSVFIMKSEISEDVRIEEKEIHSDTPKRFKDRFEISGGSLDSETESRLVQISETVPGRIAGRIKDKKLWIFVQGETESIRAKGTEGSKETYRSRLNEQIERVKKVVG